MATFAEQWLSEGIERGRKEGLEKGLEKGREQGATDEARSLLERQIGLKFCVDVLPESIYQKINAASKDQLEVWALKIFTTNTMDEIFE